MHLKKTCPQCSGTGWIFDFWNPANWIPFNWNIKPFVRCPRCGGRGYTYSVWRDRRKSWR
jgi:ribosomal protein S27AE